MRDKLYHMGIHGKISRSILADANEKRDWRIYHDFAHILIRHARKLYADEDFGLQLDETVYALDATIIDLCLSVFPWSKFRKYKGAVKLHILPDLRGVIPTVVSITDGKDHELNVLDRLIAAIGVIYIRVFPFLFTLLLNPISASIVDSGKTPSSLAENVDSFNDPKYLSTILA